MFLAMNALPLILVLAIVGAVYWTFFRGRSAGADGQSAHFGFGSEAVRLMWVGEFATDASGANRTARELLAGVTQGVTGAALDLRIRGASVAVSQSGRISVVVQTDGDAQRFVHGPGEVTVTVEGAGTRSIQGGPSVVVRFDSSQLSGLRLLLHESAKAHLT